MNKLLLVSIVFSTYQSTINIQYNLFVFIVQSNNVWSARLRHQRHLSDKTPHAEPYISEDNSMNPVSLQ